MRVIYTDKERTLKYFRHYSLSLKKILNNLFNHEIKKMTYLGNNKLSQMPEYNFRLLKFNIVLDDYSNYSVFVRLIDKYKEEENLFCYWFFCEENYSVHTKFFAPKANIINYEPKEYERRYELQLLKQNNKIWKSSFVDIINLNKYCEKNFEGKNRRELNKDLFIAVL